MTDDTSPRCRVCGGAPSRHLTAVERTFGFGDRIDYIECGDCGCLQIVEVPDDLGRYYAEGYYSFEVSAKKKSWRKATVDRYALFGGGPLAALLHAHKPNPFYRLLRQLGIGPRHRLLDVGCGHGALVVDLRSHGFTRAVGIDKFLRETVVIDGAPVVRQGDIFEVDETFDMVMFHHSLEHMENQAEVLAKARAIVAADGYVIVRIPTVSSFAYRHYQDRWAALDAPRHFYLHSRRSITQLAERCGFAVERLVDDSTDRQFWDSERCRRDIPLTPPDRSAYRSNKDLFSPSELRDFRRRARELNRQGEGDQICVVLKPR